jgi:hypothetical protein
MPGLFSANAGFWGLKTLVIASVIELSEIAGSENLPVKSNDLLKSHLVSNENIIWFLQLLDILPYINVKTSFYCTLFKGKHLRDIKL